MKVSASVVPPPGDGVTTVILAVPGFWTRAAGTCAVSLFVFTKIAVSGEAFQSTVDAGVKVVTGNRESERRLPGAGMLVGEIVAIVGDG